MIKTLKNGVEILIREVTLEDTEEVLKYMQKVNEETKNLSREPDEFNLTFEQEYEFIKKVVKSENEMMITAWDNDKLISVCGFHGSSLQRLRHRVSMGISVIKDYHNLGLGSILMNEIVSNAKKYNKKILELDVRIDNEAAIRIYEKVGFVKEGIKKGAFYVDGKYVDLLLMAKEL